MTIVCATATLSWSPDGGQLVVADTQTPNLWAFRVEADGSLTHEQPYYIAHVPTGQPGSEVPSGRQAYRCPSQAAWMMSSWPLPSRL